MDPPKPSWLQQKCHKDRFCTCYRSEDVNCSISPCAVKLYSTNPCDFKEQNNQPSSVRHENQTQLILRLSEEKACALNDFENLQHKFNQLQTENANLKFKVSEHEKYKNAMVVELEKKVCEQSESILKLSEAKACALHDFENSQNDFKQIQSENAKLKLIEVELKDLATTWEQRCEQIRACNVQLHSKNDQLELKITDLTKKLQLSEHESHTISVKYDSIFAEQLKLNAHIKQFEEKCSKSQSDQILLNKKISALESDLQSQTKSFEDEKFKLIDALKSLDHASKLLEKENIGLKASHDVLTQKLDTRSQPKVPVPEKIYSCKSPKPFVKKVSQFTNYSLQKAKKYSEKPYSSGTFTSSFLSFSDNSSFISNAHNRMKNHEWKRQPKVSSSTTQAKSFSYTFTKLFELAPRPVCPVVQQVNDFVLKNPSKFKTPSSFNSQSKTKEFSSPLRPRKLFYNETPCLNLMWNAMSVHQIDSTYIWFSKVSKTIGPILKWVPKVVSK